jgi:hypothetical protein
VARPSSARQMAKAGVTIIKNKIAIRSILVSFRNKGYQAMVPVAFGKTFERFEVAVLFHVRFSLVIGMQPIADRFADFDRYQ